MGSLIPCFLDLLVTSALGFKARMASLQATDSSDSPLVWHLPWASKPGWIPCKFLRFTTGVTSADCLAASMVAEPFCVQVLVGLKSRIGLAATSQSCDKTDALLTELSQLGSKLNFSRTIVLSETKNVLCRQKPCAPEFFQEQDYLPVVCSKILLTDYKLFSLSFGTIVLINDKNVHTEEVWLKVVFILHLFIIRNEDIKNVAELSLGVQFFKKHKVIEFDFR